MVCVMMHRSEMQVLSVKFWRCSPISVPAQGARSCLTRERLQHPRACADARSHMTVLQRMPRTIFRATDRRRSSRLGASAAPDVPEMDMLHNALECVQACDRGVQKSAEAGRSHAIRAGSQPRAPAGPQHERFASCERRGVRGACTRRGHTFRGAGRAREAGGAPRLAEDVGLVSLGPA